MAFTRETLIIMYGFLRDLFRMFRVKKHKARERAKLKQERRLTHIPALQTKQCGVYTPTEVNHAARRAGRGSQTGRPETKAVRIRASPGKLYSLFLGKYLRTSERANSIKCLELHEMPIREGWREVGRAGSRERHRDTERTRHGDGEGGRHTTDADTVFQETKI